MTRKIFRKGVQCKGGEWVPGLPVCIDKRKVVMVMVMMMIVIKIID